MTRWARGGTSNTKKPHEATPWEELKQNEISDKKKNKKKPEKDGDSNKHLNEERSKMEDEPPVQKSSDTGSDSDCGGFDERITKLPHNKERSFGLAAELEKLGAESGMQEEKFERPSKSAKKLKKKMKKQKNKSKITLEVGSKTQTLLKTELTENLSSLKKSLSLSGAEEVELQDIIKKDQRRENRRLKRIDKKADGKVCFNCRQKGHTISDCPESKSQYQGTGICFKCGSTEHAVAQCRLRLPEGRFPYAKCFICGEQGHLSKQCPDNPRGLYPNGGCCRTCSSVEHYNKDCPLLQQQQGIQDYKLATLKNISGSVDEEVSLVEIQQKFKPKKTKVVKF